jgi:hemerythrin superfamily protein
MDVLQIIKGDHQELREALGRATLGIEDANSADLLRKLVGSLRLHLKLEVDYLYPEISSVLNGASPDFLKRSLENHKTIADQLNQLDRHLSDRSIAGASGLLSPLQKTVMEHLELEETVLMPRLREAMPTSHREGLGEVFLDLKDIEEAAENNEVRH